MSKYVGLYMNEDSQKIYKMNNEKTFLLERPLKVEEIKCGVILPSKEDLRLENKKLWAVGGVLDEVGNFVVASEMGNLWGGEYHYDLAEECIIDEDVLFMGPFVAHWGHFICDEISRLWYYAKKKNENLKIAYCSWLFGQDVTNFNIYGNFLDLLHLIGIKDSQLINVTKPTRFRKIIIPEISFVSRQYYSEEYKFLLKTIIDNVDSSGMNNYEKVYFTRQNFSEAKNKEYGEKEIVDFFEENGYKILAPELLSVNEQIHFFQHCKTVAMISGTISHNLVFSSPGIQAVILNKLSIDNDYQIIVDHIADAKITYIDVYFKGLPVLFGAGPFWIGMNNHLKKWAAEQSMNIKKNVSNKCKGFFWYIKKYKQTYVDNAELRFWLKDQQQSLHVLKQSMKNKDIS